MHVEVREDGNVALGWAGRPRLRGFQVFLRTTGVVRPSASPWEETRGTDLFGAFRAWRRPLLWEGAEVMVEHLFLYENALRYEVRFPRGLAGLRGSRDFLDPALVLPLFSADADLNFLLFTFGLDGAAGDFPGGYWPEARWGKVKDGFPRKPFAPLVLYDGEGALAVAPGELFLLSPLGAFGGEIGRALAGDFPEIPAGTVLSTWFAFGKDPGEALRRLGEILLRLGGKERADPDSTPLLSRLGYWNAYGSYYTELIHPMEEGILRALAAEFRARKIPVGYVGLDLWYPYERIGQALEFRPDRRKYPRGLAALQKETGLPYVLHLSALSKRNAYATDGANPEVYAAIAVELREQGAIGVWHDWLRTWQYLTPALLSDPWQAERWFSEMCRAFREVGLPVLLCMETIGMVLASTREPNVVAARSFTDHLFSLRPALRQAARTDPGIAKAWQRPVEIWLQNLLVGYAQWALGLAPFHDLFLSREHPGFGGEHAWEDAVLRALSCGPIGFGDACGMADQKLLNRLLLPDGRLAQPDRPPEPLWATLATPTPMFWTETRAGDLRWFYVLVLNRGEEELKVRLALPQEEDCVVWDPRAGALTPEEVAVPAGGLAYRVFLPRVGDAGLLGLPGLLVPMPARLRAEFHRRGKLCARVPENAGLHAVLAPNIIVLVEDLRGIEVKRRE